MKKKENRTALKVEERSCLEVNEVARLSGFYSLLSRQLPEPWRGFANFRVSLISLSRIYRKFEAFFFFLTPRDNKKTFRIFKRKLDFLWTMSLSL